MMMIKLLIKNEKKPLVSNFVVRAIFLAFILSLLPAQVWGGVSDFRYYANIKQNDISSDYTFLELPDQVLSQTQPGLPDLRIYSNEEEIPYALIMDQELTIPLKNERVEMLNRGTDARGNLIFEVHIPQGQWINRIHFISSQKNFIRNVQVDGNQNQQGWVNLVGDSTIFDLTQEGKSRHLEVNVPPTNFSSLRVTIGKGGKGSFEPEGVEIAYVNPASIAAHIKERPHETRQENSKDGIQEYVLDLYQSHLTSRELEIITGEKNFNRVVELHASDNSKDWQLVTKGEVYSYRLDKLTAKQLSLTFRSTLRYFKLKIYNQDNPPLGIQEIKIRGANPAMVFPIQQNKEVSLYWNSDQVKAPVYDLQKFRENLDYDKTPKASLESAIENEAFQFQDSRPWSERNSWLLQLMLVIVATVLLGVSVLSIRKIRS